MSDISLNLNGVIALLLAGALSLFLLLGIAICAVIAGMATQEKGTPFTRHPAFAHLRGLALSLPGFVGIVWFILANDSVSAMDAAKIGLDKWSLLWTAIFLMPWPLSVFAAKRKRRSPDAQ